MNNDQHTILPHAFRTRTTPHEAERLLTEWAREDEAILRFAVCVAVASVALPWIYQFFGGIEHAFTVLQPRLLGPAHYALASITHLLGGIL
jgi:hypothetical protein